MMKFILCRPYIRNGIVVLLLRMVCNTTPNIRYELRGDETTIQQKVTSLHHWHTPVYITRHTILYQQTHQYVAVTHTHASLLQQTCQSTPVTHSSLHQEHTSLKQWHTILPQQTHHFTPVTHVCSTVHAGLIGRVRYCVNPCKSK